MNCIKCQVKFDGSFTGECPACEQKSLEEWIKNNERREVMTTIEKIKLGQAAIEGYYKCECEPEVNAVPCRVCAVDTALRASAAEIEALKRQIVDAECLAASWKGTAVSHCRNESFYRSLIVKIGEPFGIAAKTSDDGSIQEDVLALKVPELVDSLRSTVAELQKDKERLDRQVAALKVEYSKQPEWTSRILEQQSEIDSLRSRNREFMEACVQFIAWFHVDPFKGDKHWQELPDIVRKAEKAIAQTEVSRE